MRYRTLIADDESMIRYGLSSCIRWEEEGLELAGEASNGETALELVRLREVDILITDIKMPRMDGLELIHRAKEFRPHLKAVLISSYSDFEYARRAVQLGAVVDYLLKPTMEPEDLLRLLRVCREKLEGELAAQRRSELYANEGRRYRRREFGQQLKRLLDGAGSGSNGVGRDLEWQPEWKPELPEAPLLLSVWRLEARSADAGGVSSAALPAPTPFAASASPLTVLDGAPAAASASAAVESAGTLAERLEALHRDGIAVALSEFENVLVTSNHDGLGESQLWSSHKQLLDSGCRCTVGISPVFHSWGRVADAYGWARHALLQAFFHGYGRCYKGEIVRGAGGKRAQTAPLSADNPQWLGLRDRFSRALAGGDQKEGAAALEAVFAYWRGGEHVPEEIVRQAGSLLMMLFSRRFYLKTEEKLQLLVDRLRQASHHAFTLEELIQDLRERFEELHSFEPSLTSAMEESGGQHAVQLALGYIQENYRRDLSLQEVADQVHMSRNYFSELFKKRTGYNFIEFVLRLRLYYAKHLLETTAFKVHDIGAMAGFNSPKHFLKLFKRELGCTPAEYRHRTEGKPHA